MRLRVIPNALLLSLILVVTLFMVALAEDYTIPLMVDGKAYTITVHVDGGEVTGATSDSTKVQVSKPTKVMKAVDAKQEEGNDHSIGGATANKSANLRSGPGTNYLVAGSVQAGQALKVVGKNQAGSWVKLEDGKLIAAFLVVNAPTNLPIAEAAAPESVASPVVANNPTPQQPKPQAAGAPIWRTASVQTCGDFEWKVVDVRTTKETWHYDEKTVARGQYLIVYVEIKNVGPGTSDLESSSAPRLNGRGYDFDPSWDAAWMMTGGHNVTWNDYNPGEVITVVAGFDVQPGDGYTFGMANCGQSVMIGAWDQIVKGVIRAN